MKKYWDDKKKMLVEKPTKEKKNSKSEIEEGEETKQEETEKGMPKAE